MDKILNVKDFIQQMFSLRAGQKDDASLLLYDKVGINTGNGSSDSSSVTPTNYVHIQLSRLNVTSYVAFDLQIETDLGSFPEQKFSFTTTVESLEKFMKTFFERNYDGYFIHVVDFDYLSYLRSYYLETSLDNKDAESEESGEEGKAALNKRLNSLITGMIATTILYQFSCFTLHPTLQRDQNIVKFLTTTDEEQNNNHKIIPYNSHDIKKFGKTFRKNLIDFKNKLICEKEIDEDYAELYKKLPALRESHSVLKDHVENLIVLVMDGGFHFSDIFTFNIKYIVKRNFRFLGSSNFTSLFENLRNFETLNHHIVAEKVEYLHYFILFIQSIVSGISRVCERRTYEICKLKEFQKKYQKSSDVVAKTKLKEQIEKLTDEFENRFNVLGKEELKTSLKEIQKLLLSKTIDYAKNIIELYKKTDENLSTTFNIFSNLAVKNQSMFASSGLADKMEP